jgi:hypothetical protein
MVVLCGDYKSKVGLTIQYSEVQAFHHLKCDTLTNANDPVTPATIKSPTTGCYPRGTNLLQIQVAKQFDLKMCTHCIGRFTTAQQEIWNHHRYTD